MLLPARALPVSIEPRRRRLDPGGAGICDPSLLEPWRRKRVELGGGGTRPASIEPWRRKRPEPGGAGMHTGSVSVRRLGTLAGGDPELDAVSSEREPESLSLSGEVALSMLAASLAAA